MVKLSGISESSNDNYRGKYGNCLVFAPVFVLRPPYTLENM